MDLGTTACNHGTVSHEETNYVVGEVAGIDSSCISAQVAPNSGTAVAWKMAKAHYQSPVICLGQLQGKENALDNKPYSKVAKALPY